jgi:hypothetical protein
MDSVHIDGLLSAIIIVLGLTAIMTIVGGILAVVGPAHVHRIMRGWLAALGHDAYAVSEEPGESVTTRVPGAVEAT